MLTFLEINGYRVRGTDRELADWIINLSSGRTAQSLAHAIREQLAPTGREA